MRRCLLAAAPQRQAVTWKTLVKKKIDTYRQDIAHDGWCKCCEAHPSAQMHRIVPERAADARLELKQQRPVNDRAPYTCH